MSTETPCWITCPYSDFVRQRRKLATFTTRYGSFVLFAKLDEFLSLDRILPRHAVEISDRYLMRYVKSFKLCIPDDEPIWGRIKLLRPGQSDKILMNTEALYKVFDKPSEAILFKLKMA